MRPLSVGSCVIYATFFLVPTLGNSRQSSFLSPPMASLHLSVKDVTEILKLLILILELIPKLRECIRYFRRGGWNFRSLKLSQASAQVVIGSGKSASCGGKQTIAD
nr:hypothetical protein CFP56_51847 [Quercus suber]